MLMSVAAAPIPLHTSVLSVGLGEVIVHEQVQAAFLQAELLHSVAQTYGGKKH